MKKVGWNDPVVCTRPVVATSLTTLHSLQVYLFPRIFTDFQGTQNYKKIYGISSVIHGKFMACFSIVPMKRQAINFPKLCRMRDYAV